MLEEIQAQIQQQHIHVQHIFREGNRIADFLANQALEEQREFIYNNFRQLSNLGRHLVNINKAQIPDIKIRTKRIRVQQA